ncbi:hypothetical protein NGK27_14955 [Klebsiella quasipneumoniae]|uniref:hypothetical protein n=1 Tax=Klebsiella quasipneumoniae TaxID=1463165 RepID=UPI002DBF1966|nr:hypothetical protein [Klebsiella quasipneumoniae]MEB7828551.1 hypothetical protein [Klebsiella quasipneumoniae]
MTPLGVYGYIFTKEMIFDGGTLTPRFNNLTDLKKKKCNRESYILTGFFTPNPKNKNNISQLLFDLSAVLSFIEQKNVIIAHSLKEDETPSTFGDDFPTSLDIKRKRGPGQIIMEDCFSKHGRSEFIRLAINKLSDNITADQNPFRTAFFKSMFSFRENINYVDVNYYLSFSALESLCRYIQDDYNSRKTPQIITTTLQNYGFDVSKKDNALPQRNIMHYCALRNSLFHKGDYIAYTKNDDPDSIIYLKNYSSSLCLLLSLFIMKYIGFDDNYINWDSWIDRQPFISR